MTLNKSPWQWAGLVALSAPLAWVFWLAGFPAALLVGPMLAGMALGAAGASITIPNWAFVWAQAVIGCLVAGTINASILASIAHDWINMLLAVSVTIAAAVLAAWLLARRGVVSGAAAAWGSSPGGAAAMTAMSQAYGVDMRFVAFMQYFRMFLVVISASGISKLLMGSGQGLPGPGLEMEFSAPLTPLLETMAVALGGAILGVRLRIPSGALVVPMAIGGALQASGLAEMTLPTWLLGSAYTALGWYIGLRFTRQVVAHVLRALPALTLSTLMLLGLCGVSAWFLTRFGGVDALSAYLATSPGGLDSIAIIAVGSHSDIPFIMALQTLRLFAVIACWPWLARLIARYA